MINHPKPPTKILFLDIETTSKTNSFYDLTVKEQSLFLKSYKRRGIDDVLNDSSLTEAQKVAKIEEIYSNVAPIFAEWGRILCISVGYLVEGKEPGVYGMKITSFASKDEKQLLTDFVTKLDKQLNNINMNDASSYALCSHNGEIFDGPYIARRLFFNGIRIPKMFDLAHSKPWERQFSLDLKKEYSMGIFDANISLDTLATALDIPSSKEEGISGEDVKRVFYEESNLEKITKYCEADVLCTARIYLRMKYIDFGIQLT